MKKIISILILISVVSLFVGVVNVYASTDVDGIIGEMSGVDDIGGMGTSGVAGSINDIIGLLQVAGTGIALIVITMLGIKYLIASPSEKADTKKQIMPILIGCILVFGGVTVVKAILDLSTAVK